MSRRTHSRLAPARERDRPGGGRALPTAGAALLLASLLALGGPLEVEAQQRPGVPPAPQVPQELEEPGPREGISFSLLPDVTWTNWDDDTGISSTTLIGGTLSIGFGRFVDLQGYYRRDAGAAISAVGLDDVDVIEESEVDVASYGGQLVFSLGEGDFVPILLGGGGIYSFEPTATEDFRRLKLNFGAGFRAMLADWANAEVTAEGQRYRLTQSDILELPGDVEPPEDADDDMRTNFSVRAGLGFMLGGTAAVAPARATDRAIQERRITDIAVAIEPFAGVMNFSGETGLDDQEHIGARLGVDFGPFFGVRGFYWHGVESGFDSFENIRGWGGEAQFNLSDRPGVTPFLVAGGGQIDFDSDFEAPEGIETPSDQTALILGGGIDFNLGERIRLAAAVRDYITAGDDFVADEGLGEVESPGDLLHNWQYSGAIKFLVGGGEGFRTAGQRPEMPEMDPAVEAMDWRQQEIERRARELIEEADLTDEERDARLERLERLEEERRLERDGLEQRDALRLRDRAPADGEPAPRQERLRAQEREELHEIVREAVEEALDERLEDALQATLEATLEAALEDALETAFEDARMEDGLGIESSDELRELIRDAVDEALQERERPVRDRAPRDGLRDGLGIESRSELIDLIRQAVDDAIREREGIVREREPGVQEREPRDAARPDGLGVERDELRQLIQDAMDRAMEEREPQNGLPPESREELRALVQEAVAAPEISRRLDEVVTRSDLEALEQRLAQRIEESVRTGLEDREPRMMPWPGEGQPPAGEARPDPREAPAAPPAREDRPERTEELPDGVRRRPGTDEEPVFDDDPDAGDVREALQEDLQLSQFRPYAGFAVNDPTQAVLGLTADLGPITSGSSWRLLPEIALGFGEGPTSFMAVANLEYQVPWVFQQRNFRFDPLVGVGAGLLNHDDLGAVLNLFYGGVLHLTGDGGQPGDGLSIFIAHQGVDIFTNNRILAGLTFGAPTPAGPSQPTGGTR